MITHPLIRLGVSEIPWFNVDDGFANSKPVLRIPRRYRCPAIGLWTLAGSWSAKELTDGFIPDHAIEEFASTPAMAGFLVKAGLWIEVVGGWQFEGWSKWQKTKDQVLTFRAAEAERKRLARCKPKGAGTEGVSGVDSGRTEPGVPPGRDAESGLPIPEPLPSPIPLVVETLGGGVTQVDSDPEPPRYCNEHPNDTDRYCPECIPLRKAHDAWTARNERRSADELEVKRQQRQSIVDAVRNCLDCDKFGRIEIEGQEALAYCPKHPRLKEAANA